MFTQRGTRVEMPVMRFFRSVHAVNGGRRLHKIPRPHA
ncbi:hypothetical protein APS_0438 [Acetobacter pasteurianus subsp. pasteurianus LMG 1262 = NBRC 106471]|nr:hypothetical protein APS_0438 [Acetobacter pasteurianus subsp. pasteurianus LMG 1262 = NBRC 106471]